MFDLTFERTQNERTGDNTRPYQFNHSQEHKDRVEAHRKRVEREKQEMRAAQEDSIND